MPVVVDRFPCHQLNPVTAEPFKIRRRLQLPIQARRGNLKHIRRARHRIFHNHAIDDSSGAVGTFVNGEKIKWHTALRHGDRIKVGTLELEIQYTPDEEPEEKPVPKTRTIAARAVVQANDDQEPDITQWVGEDGKKADKHVPSPALPLATPAGIDAGKARAAAVAVPATQERRQRPHWREIEVEWEGTDLLLFATIGILAIVVLCMVFPMIPWPDWHWHPMALVLDSHLLVLDVPVMAKANRDGLLSQSWCRCLSGFALVGCIRCKHERPKIVPRSR